AGSEQPARPHQKNDDEDQKNPDLAERLAEISTLVASGCAVQARHCEEPTGPARSGRPDDRLRNEAIQPRLETLDCFACARNDATKFAPTPASGTPPSRWRNPAAGLP